MLSSQVTRRRAVAAKSIGTHMCLSSSSFVELVRRLVIISVEDAILHPDIAVLTWLMCATSKGFEPTDALRASVIRITGELAAVQVRDEPAYGPNTPLTLNDVETKLSESHDESTVVQSLIIRAHFGGMPGDVAMLHGFSRVWLERFTQMSCDANVPVDYDALLNRNHRIGRQITLVDVSRIDFRRDDGERAHPLRRFHETRRHTDRRR